MEPTTTTVAYLNRDHPAGQFRRNGKVFHVQPQIFELTDSEIEDLEKIPKIINLRFDEESIERFSPKIEAADDTAGDEGDDDDEKVDDKETGGEDDKANEVNGEGANDEEKKDDSEEVKNDFEAPEELKDLTQEELIAKLEAKGLTAGADFEPSADKQSLIELLTA